jgi:hypothetical protein
MCSSLVVANSALTRALADAEGREQVAINAAEQ